MLLKDDKKKMVTIIAGKLGEKPVETENDVEQDKSIGLESAAEEIISAVHSKSPKAVVEAMKSFMEMCEYQDDSADQENV